MATWQRIWTRCDVPIRRPSRRQSPRSESARDERHGGFDRRLAYVYDLSGNSIDVRLVVGGYARTWAEDGQHPNTLVAPKARALAPGRVSVGRRVQRAGRRGNDGGRPLCRFTCPPQAPPST